MRPARRFRRAVTVLGVEGAPWLLCARLFGGGWQAQRSQRMRSRRCFVSVGGRTGSPCGGRRRRQNSATTWVRSRCRRFDAAGAVVAIASVGAKIKDTFSLHILRTSLAYYFWQAAPERTTWPKFIRALIPSSYFRIEPEHPRLSLRPCLALGLLFMLFLADVEILTPREAVHRDGVDSFLQRGRRTSRLPWRRCAEGVSVGGRLSTSRRRPRKHPRCRKTSNPGPSCEQGWIHSDLGQFWAQE